MKLTRFFFAFFFILP
ncbi:hypothetical protein GME99_22935 [Salmonella enterica]|nr:hypothetical protein [Salmonella enterica]ECL8537856.1 hypothetical protein [Salmonella enterica]EEB6739307.1 hypothetical protein [Salmonella enterica]EEG9037463.1 hypothetical protein [Salmonella enterica]ELM1408251.1 pheA operon leader peptide PheL [Salmonella enterica]